MAGGESAGDGAEFDLITVGETMATFVSQSDPTRYIMTAGGAESNVAVGTARLGLRTRWVSRLGDDPLGYAVARSITDAGVDVRSSFDPLRPTGVMVKHIDGHGTRVDYYRKGSAASALHPEDLGRAGRARTWHVTGITPALSDSAHDLVRALVEAHGGIHGRTSLDINYRSKLWSSPGAAAAALQPLARQSNVVFIGDDEAEALFNTSDHRQIAGELHGDNQELVIKHGSRGASVMSAGETIFEPALQVDVVDATGAGDSFAAGYLAARSWGWPLPARLRLGHLVARRVLGTIEDVPPPFADGELDATLRQVEGLS
ncbi:MAG: sugar kinase [Acidimicrobiia bacterium]|nr:sugar kinase [Acidimicrobiia bacterium]